MRVTRDYSIKFNYVKDKKIKILANKKSNVSDKGASVNDFYVLYDSLWANYRSLSGNEYYREYAADMYIHEAVFTINWHEGITAGMYIIFKGKPYKITYVDDLEGYK